VELVDPLTIDSPHLKQWDMEPALQASKRMQEYLHEQGLLQQVNMPLLRLWPHTENTGGFFCAVFTKTTPTSASEPLKRPKLVRECKSDVFQRDLTGQLQKQYGATLPKDIALFEERGVFYYATHDTVKHPLFSHSFVAGLPLGKVRRHQLTLDYFAGLQLQNYEDDSVIEISNTELNDFYHGKDLIITRPDGLYVLQFNNLTIAPVKVRAGRIKNTLPRSVILKI
jgi:NOL1/NOP2/fmu family ribosome biogenesis protein